MFDFLKPKRSLIRKELKSLMWVHRTWYEWSIEGGRRESVLVVEMAIDLDPNAKDFETRRIDEVAEVIARCARVETGPDRVRVIPRMYGL